MNTSFRSVPDVGLTEKDPGRGGRLTVTLTAAAPIAVAAEFPEESSEEVSHVNLKDNEEPPLNVPASITK